MFFCGQCGLLLAPNIKTCPRCGALVENNKATVDPNLDYSTEYMQLDAPDSTPPRQPQGRGKSLTPENPQKLILRSDDANYAYNGQGANEATNLMDAAGYNPQMPPIPANQNVRSSLPGYNPASGGNYAGQRPSANPISQSNWVYHPVENQHNEPAPPSIKRRGRGRIVALLLILMGLLLILTAIILFTLNLNGFFANNQSSTPTPTATLTPAQQAQGVIQQYYDDINKKDYQGAYQLYDNPTQTYDQFAQGYAHTQQDTITFNSTKQLSDGTYQIQITIAATEDATTGGTITKHYQVKYVVGIKNGAWKILSGQAKLLS